MDTKGEEFGEGKLADLVNAHKTESARKVMNIVIEAVNQHASDCSQLDDMTIVVIKRGDN